MDGNISSTSSEIETTLLSIKMCVVDCLLLLLVLPLAAQALKAVISPSLIPGISFAQANKIETLKLPVWPVWSGVLAQILDWTGQPALSEQLISKLGGRVVPMDLSNANVSPFLLLAHHSHSFMPLDPFRLATTFFLPEGFPAHPHSGFDTVTYCIDGGLRHRDSEAIQQTYGDGDTQWMRAGRGVIHEEMWDTGDYWNFKKIEIFQLWVNLRYISKNKTPQCQVIKASTVPQINLHNGVTAKVISGIMYRNDEDNIVEGPGGSIADSPVCISHLTMKPNSKCFVSIPSGSSAAMYIRRGGGRDGCSLEPLSVHNLIKYSSNPSTSDAIQLGVESGDNGLDALLQYTR
jgi:redox-sensitive bicupin YhaK (pirin superfamily)